MKTVMTIKKTTGYVLLLLLSTLMVSVWYGVAWIQKTFPSLPLGSHANYVLALFIVVLVTAALWFFERKSPGEYGLSLEKNNLRTAFVFLGLLFPIAILGRITDPGFDLWYAQESNLLTLSGVLLFVPLMALAVFMEEIIERVFLQSRLTSYVGKTLAVVILSVQFAILHYIGRDNGFHAAMMVVFVFLGSLMIASLFAITQSVVATILLHFLSNLMVTVQIYLHATSAYGGEFLLWLVWGLLFVWSFSEGVQMFRNLLNTSIPKISLGGWAFLMVFGIVGPLILVLV